MPEISIIVPIYNKEHCLPKCLDSIMNQSFADFECILIDDGSKDGSLAICREYSSRDSRFIVFAKENGGVSSARNAGLDNAKGNYIVLIDPDDYVKEDYLLNLYEPEYDLVCTRVAYKYENSDELTFYLPDYDRVFDVSYDNLATLLDDAWIEFSASKSFRKSVIDKNNIRFLEGLSWGEDTLFALAVASKCIKIHVKREFDYYYIGYGESTSLSTLYSRKFYSYCKMFSNELRRQLNEDFNVTELRDEFIKRILFMYEKTIVYCATVAYNLPVKERIKEIKQVIADEEYQKIRPKSGKLSYYRTYTKLALKSNNATIIVLTAAFFKPIAVFFRKFRKKKQ